MTTTKNDKAWQEILEDNPKIIDSICKEGFCDIPSELIKEHHREPRLACKIDFREHIPQPLKKESISVLAIQNGLYRLAKTDTFLDVPTEQIAHSTPEFQLPERIQTISTKELSSESKALDVALLSGMLNELFDDEVSLVLRGRERCSEFNFSLKDLASETSIAYDIKGVQVEVDGGYEGEKGIYLIEAKNKVNANINLRQLLYPHLHYSRKFEDIDKKVYSYLHFYNPLRNEFHFNKVHINNRDSSLDPIETYIDDPKIYSLKESTASSRDYWGELHEVPENRDRVDKCRPFPQADNFNRVFAMYLNLFESGQLSRDDLFSHYALDPRQWDYYGNALRWLKIVDWDSNSKEFSINNLGRSLYSSDLKITLYELAEIALSNDIFNQFLHNGRQIQSISAISRERNSLITESTFRRRMQTVKSWLAFFESELRSV